MSQFIRPCIATSIVALTLLFSTPYALAVALDGGLIDFAGRYSYSVSEDSVTIAINRIENRSSASTSGVLRIELWANTSGFDGGSLSGTQAAEIQTARISGLSNKLPPNASFRNIEFTTSYTTPDFGQSVHTLVLTEYSDSCEVNDGYCPIAYESFDGFTGGEQFGPAEVTEYTAIYGFDVTPVDDGVFDGASESTFETGSLSDSDYELNSGYYLDVFEFTLVHESDVNITLDSNQFGPYMYLVRVNAAHDPIFIQEIDGVSNMAQFSDSLPRGTYWIGASNSLFGETGSYRVDVEITAAASLDVVERVPTDFGLGIEVNNNPYEFGILTATDPVLDDGSHVDAFQISITSAIEYQIDLQSIEFDPYLIVARVLPGGGLDPLETYQNDDFDGLNSRINLVMYPGTYWVAVNTYSPGQIGGYLLTMRPSP